MADGITIKGADAEIDRLLKELKKIETEAALKVGEMAVFILRNMISNTPVWSGETVRNYVISVGAKSSARVSPIGSPPYGDTNSMPLGPEPMRAANAQAAIGFAEGTAKTYVSLSKPIFVHNTIDAGKADLIDNGDAPDDKRGRNKVGGVSKRAEMMARAAYGKFVT